MCVCVTLPVINGYLWVMGSCSEGVIGIILLVCFKFFFFYLYSLVVIFINSLLWCFYFFFYLYLCHHNLLYHFICLIISLDAYSLSSLFIIYINHSSLFIFHIFTNNKKTTTLHHEPFPPFKKTQVKIRAREKKRQRKKARERERVSVSGLDMLACG